MNASLLLQCAIMTALLAASSGARAVDSDGDGVEDNADNCINVANADQRDTNADGFGNICDADLNNDLFVNFADLAALQAVFFLGLGDAGYDPDADFNGDDFINFGDLLIMKEGFFQPPGPSGDDPGPDPGVEIDVDTLTIPEPLCRPGESHELFVSWTVRDAVGRVDVDMTIVLPDGDIQTFQSNATAGTMTFVLDAPLGGPVTVLTSVVDADGSSTVDTTLTALPPCETNPPPVPPDLGFEGPPATDPPILGVPDSDANEVDIVHLGGSPNGPTPAKVVAAAGTGSGVKMFSFGIDNGSFEPVFLQEVGPFAGKEIRLHVLTPELSPTLTVRPFVSGVIRNDGNLWIATWQVFNDGSFMDFDTVGYGANADQEVLAYDIAHRVLSSGRFQVVTPVLTARNKLRTITWEVNDATGDLTGRSDSGDWGNPDPDAQPSIAHLDGSLYVVSYRDADGNMATRYWDVGNNGTPNDAFGAVSGLNHTGTGTAVEGIVATVNLPITTTGFVTPIVQPNGPLKLDTWETRFFSWGEGGVSYMPYLVSDSTQDQNPAGFGVTIPQPSLTNATDGNGAFIANVRAQLTDGLIEDDFGVGSGELFLQMPNGELTSVHSASVTKNMTLLVAVEAVQDGEVDLDDLVTISAAAANVGGSAMGPNSSTSTDDLQEDEVQSLRNLMYGMMLRSANDASAAIAEHISGAGNFAAFVQRMNNRAADLDMDDTTYNVPGEPAGAPANSVITAPWDQIRLWRFGIENSMYLQFASTTTYDACGEDSEGDERCYFLNKGSHAYPGTQAWKNGNGGHFIPGYSDNGGPYCVGSGCLVAHANRLDRDMVVAIQQSGSRWGDADRLWEYGYRTQFTPDHRGPVVISINKTDFAMDKVMDTLGVMADIDTSGNFSVCTWSLFADGGSQGLIGCHDPRYTGVAGSIDRAAPALVDGVRISTLLADGDYWIGRLVGSQVNLDLWRVGPNEP